MSGIASKSGDQLEDKVGAHYLLTLLAQSEPRGLPGTTINTLKFQSAGEGYPLDDITVAAHDSQGKEAILEIQVKRKLTFTRDDQQFQKIVGQIINASHKPEFNQSNYKLAIALARTSAQIDGAYQDVLTWARAMTDPDAFIARCTEKDNGSANKSTRLFIEVFKEFLNDNGESNDNGTVFGLLKKLQILIFDFTVKHSQADELVNERCANVLHADDKKQASKLWGSLVTIAQDQGACGGTLSRDQLISEIRNLRYRLTGEREYTSSRRVIAELTALSLKAIPDTILDIHLPRIDYLHATRASLEKQRYVEIRGEAGVGKSAVLKHLALQASEQSCVILLSPKRTPGKGWQKFSSDIRFDGTARELLIDLESSGGGTLFIDNLDFFTEDQRTTVSDFIRTAAEIDGFSVIATARHNFGQDESNWLPLDELDRLGVAQPVVVHELSDTEINQIRLAAPKLAPLLDVNHPARTVVRNLFKLSQLVEHSIEGNDIIVVGISGLYLSI